MTQQGDRNFERNMRTLAEQVAEACRGLRTPPLAAPTIPLPDRATAELAQAQQREARGRHLNAQNILDNGRDAYHLAARDPLLSQEVAPRVRVLKPEGMQRVLASGMVPDAAIQSLSGGRLQNVAQAQAMLSQGGQPAQLLTRDFSNFMESFSPARELRMPQAPAAIQQICTVVEPQHPPRTPAAPQGGGFGQPRPSR
jgi:hypothetical protein